MVAGPAAGVWPSAAMAVERDEAMAQGKGRRRTGLVILVMLLVGAALAAGALLAGWRPPIGGRGAGIDSAAGGKAREVIAETERRSLDRVLKERSAARRR